MTFTTTTHVYRNPIELTFASDEAAGIAIWDFDRTPGMGQIVYDATYTEWGPWARAFATNGTDLEPDVWTGGGRAWGRDGNAWVAAGDVSHETRIVNPQSSVRVENMSGGGFTNATSGRVILFWTGQPERLSYIWQFPNETRFTPVYLGHDVAVWTPQVKHEGTSAHAGSATIIRDAAVTAGKDGAALLVAIHSVGYEGTLRIDDAEGSRTWRFSPDDPTFEMVTTSGPTKFTVDATSTSWSDMALVMAEIPAGIFPRTP